MPMLDESARRPTLGGEERAAEVRMGVRGVW